MRGGAAEKGWEGGEEKGWEGGGEKGWEGGGEGVLSPLLAVRRSPTCLFGDV